MLLNDLWAQTCLGFHINIFGICIYILKANLWFLILVFSKISLLIYFILAFLAGIVFSAIYMYILTKISFCINPRTYMPEYLVQFSFIFTLSLILCMYIFFDQPWNCMREYWCLKRYPFWFTLSLHSFQLDLFQYSKWIFVFYSVVVW